jgi:hypothetical protein
VLEAQPELVAETSIQAPAFVLRNTCLRTCSSFVSHVSFAGSLPWLLTARALESACCVCQLLPIHLMLVRLLRCAGGPP